MFRYCDDMVICWKYKNDADRITKALKGRLDRFSLKLNEEKTKVVSFSKRLFDKGCKKDSFDFLGFTFYLARSRNGGVIVKLKTYLKRIRSKLKNVKYWIKKNRHSAPMKILWQKFCAKLQGAYSLFWCIFQLCISLDFLSESSQNFL